MLFYKTNSTNISQILKNKLLNSSISVYSSLDKLKCSLKQVKCSLINF